MHLLLGSRNAPKAWDYKPDDMEEAKEEDRGAGFAGLHSATRMVKDSTRPHANNIALAPIERIRPEVMI